MAAKASVTDLLRIKPASSPPATSDLTVPTKYYPLTFFDTYWLKFPVAQMLFFYQIQNLSRPLFYDTILPKLKHSLSLTLQHYPTLAGTLTWHPHTGKPVFRYDHNHDGVFLSVADSCAIDFHSLSTDRIKESKHLRSLLPQPQFHISDSQTNALSLHLTLFPDYGFSIGYSLHHACSDMCRVGSLPPELHPLLDRSLIHDPSDISTVYTHHWMKTAGNKRSLVPRDAKPAPGLFRATFRLTPEQIGQLKDKIRSPVSSFTAVCSHIWTCLVEAEEVEEGITKENVYLLINMDCRTRLDPPIPDNYFGNCITIRLAKAKVASLKAGDGIVAAAMAIEEAIGSLIDHGVMEGAERLLSDVQSTIREEKVYTFGGSPRFEFYGADFGWGRPRKVEMVSIEGNGSFFINGDRDGNNGVIEIGFVMTKLKIQAFASLFAAQIRSSL